MSTFVHATGFNGQFLLLLQPVAKRMMVFHSAAHRSYEIMYVNKGKRTMKDVVWLNLLILKINQTAPRHKNAHCNPVFRASMHGISTADILNLKFVWRKMPSFSSWHFNLSVNGFTETAVNFKDTRPLHRLQTLSLFVKKRCVVLSSACMISQTVFTYLNVTNVNLKNDSFM